MYCQNCHSIIERPKLGPRKVLESGGLFRAPVYDLGIDIHQGDYACWVNFYYYQHDLFCPRCGKLLDERMDHFTGGYWASVFGEKASNDAITKYFKYCEAHPENRQLIGTRYGYPDGHMFPFSL